MRLRNSKINGIEESVDLGKDRDYLHWRRWMDLGARMGCHQRPDRSLFIKGWQMPVCARCFGTILGYMIAVPLFLFFGFLKILSFAGAILMLADWSLQATGLLSSTNTRRLITGILGGFGIMSIQLYLIKKIIVYLINDK